MKFLKYKQFQGLEQYLLKVLEVYKKSNMATDNSIQRKVLCTWIVELKLTKINEFKATNNFDVKRSNSSSQEDYEMQMMVMDSQKQALTDMEKNFHSFLVDNSADLDQDTILQLLVSHGKIDDCIKYADAMKQYQKLIVHYINKGDYKKALNKIAQIESAENRYYEMTKYMSVMIKRAASQTLNALESEKFRKIEIAKLMPALMDCPDDARPRARRFVEEHCIK